MNTKRITTCIAVVVAALLGVALGTQVAGASSSNSAWDRQPLLRPETGLSGFGPAEEITRAHARLSRTDEGIFSQVRTSAEPGTALTKWYVIFNDPAQCDGECGLGDILVLDDDGAPVMDGDDPVINHAQIEAARTSIVFGDAGAVANPGGRVKMNGGLDVGEAPDGPAQVVACHPDDDPVMAAGPVTGIEDPATAEVHIVLQGHGQAHDDAALREQQLTQFFGACNPDCPDDQFSVHK